MSDADRIAAKFEKTARNIAFAEREGVNEAARSLQAAGMTNLVGVLGPDRQMRGAFSPKTGEVYRLGVMVKQARAATSSTALVMGFPAGLFTIVETGAKKHMVGAGRTTTGSGDTKKAINYATDLRTGAVRRVSDSGRLGRAVNRKLLALPDGPALGPFPAGGSPGRKPFTRALDVVGPRIPEIVQRETRRALVRAGFK